VAFADLDIDQFADTTFEAQFRNDYITTVAAEANVSASQVEIESITPSSVTVKTLITFDSIEAGGDQVAVEAKADSFVEILTTAPAEIFKASPNFEKFGNITVASVERGLLQARTGAPTTAPKFVTISPTVPKLRSPVEESITSSSGGGEGGWMLILARTVVVWLGLLSF